MKFLLLLVALIWFSIGGLADSNVVFVNETGISIARIQIDDRIYEGTSAPNFGAKILIPVTPGVHRLKVIFRGGGYVNWPRFDFSKAHEIVFERVQNQVEARVE